MSPVVRDTTFIDQRPPNMAAMFLERVEKSSSREAFRYPVDDHPWAWAKQEEGVRTPRNAEGSRWQAGKDLSFTPLRPERVVEVRYDHMEGIRFRHTAQFVRWRPDRTPESCTYEQLEEPVKFDLADVLSSAQR